MPARVTDLVAAAAHAAPLDGAQAAGTATSGDLVVRVGLWLDAGRVARARFQATTCAALIAYAEATCAALEAGAHPDAIDPVAVRALVSGVHPVHHDRAALVARAVFHARARAAAPAAEPSRGGAE